MDNQRLNAETVEEAAVTRMCYNCHKNDIFDKIEFIGTTGLVKHYDINVCTSCKDIVLPQLQWLYDRFKPLTEFKVRQFIYIPEPELLDSKYCKGCDETLDIKFFELHKKSGKYRVKCKHCNAQRTKELKKLRKL